MRAPRSSTGSARARGPRAAAIARCCGTHGSSIASARRRGRAARGRRARARGGSPPQTTQLGIGTHAARPREVEGELLPQVAAPARVAVAEARRGRLAQAAAAARSSTPRAGTPSGRATPGLKVKRAGRAARPAAGAARRRPRGDEVGDPRARAVPRLEVALGARAARTPRRPCRARGRDRRRAPASRAGACRRRAGPSRIAARSASSSAAWRGPRAREREVQVGTRSGPSHRGMEMALPNGSLRVYGSSMTTTDRIPLARGRPERLPRHRRARREPPTSIPRLRELVRIRASQINGCALLRRHTTRATPEGRRGRPPHLRAHGLARERRSSTSASALRWRSTEAMTRLARGRRARRGLRGGRTPLPRRPSSAT